MSGHEIWLSSNSRVLIVMEVHCALEENGASVIFLNNFVKHRSIVIIYDTQHREKCDVNDCSFAHFALMLLLQLHYLVKCRSRIV